MMKWIKILCLLVLTAGCSSVRYVPVETIRRDSVYITQIRIDSVVDRDSIYIKEWAKEDTVFIDKVKWKFRDRWRQTVDTLQVVRVDSVQVPYPVEMKLNKWQSFKQDVGGLAIGLVLSAVIVFAVWWLIRRRQSN